MYQVSLEDIIELEKGYTYFINKLTVKNNNGDNIISMENAIVFLVHIKGVIKLDKVISRKTNLIDEFIDIESFTKDEITYIKQEIVNSLVVYISD